MSLVTLAEVKAMGRIDYSTHDTELTMLITQAEAFVAAHCAFSLTEQTITDERMDGGQRQLWPKVLPCRTVTSVKDAWNDDEVISSDDYFNTDTRIMAEEDGEWDPGELRFKVTYEAGYSDSTAPEGLKPSIIGLVLAAYNNPTGQSRQKARTYEIDWVQLAMDNNIIHILDHLSLRRYVE